ncbi:hypothetical protein INT44_005534 [Umbelopsis vinacea]|uniref:Plasma membrane proteolipid 3 n=1 Tax=Umbelopsis vinacea TaxID=44442 RepID=A0A8H7U9W3_9FUNG|nr:hypothetical protein INT44_005534 [Umbelopsis vinacea]
MVGDCCLIVIILLLPPLGVFLMRGCGPDFWINVILTVLGYIPGHVHAFYVWSRRETNEDSADLPSTDRELGSLESKLPKISLEHADRAGKNPFSSQDRAIFRKSRAKGHMAFFLEIGHPSQHPFNMVEIIT